MEELKNRLLRNVKDCKRIICIVLCAVMALMLIGCGKQETQADTKLLKNDRFAVKYSFSDIGETTMILQDVDTGVYYLFFKYGYGGGLTVMYNADGTLYTGG